MTDPQTEETLSTEDGRSPSPAPSEALADLQLALERQSARLDEVTRAYSRLQQDKDDFRRRAERERDRVLEIERGNVALALLEAVDQLDLSLEAVPDKSHCKNCKALADGVRLIRDGLLKQVEQNGISRLSTAGAAFDPTLHEALETSPIEDPSLDGRVLSEVRAGYRQGDRILRPARVTVGKLTARGLQESARGNN